VKKKLLTLSETLERIPLTEKALRMRIANGTFPITRIGKRLFVDEQQLERFMALQTITADQAFAKLHEE
jgi:hypothetical protein